MPDDTARLLVVLDASELGPHVAAMGAVLAARLGAEIILHAVIAIEHVDMRSAASAIYALGKHEESCRQRAAEWFAEAHAVIQPFGVSTRTVMTMDEEPSAAVQRMAEEQACGLILIGSKGRGAVSRVLGGSLVADLVRQSRVPVLVCREDMTTGWLAGAAAAARGG